MDRREAKLFGQELSLGRCNRGIGLWNGQDHSRRWLGGWPFQGFLDCGIDGWRTVGYRSRCDIENDAEPMMFHKGITGFGRGGSGVAKSAVSNTDVYRHMYATAQATGYRIQAIFPPSASTNYFRVLFRNHAILPDFDVVVNAVHPFFAAINPDSTWGNLSFVHCPEAVQQLLSPQFNYQSPAFLHRAFAEEDLQQLDPAEIQQIRYWKSHTYGEVIYNGYD